MDLIYRNITGNTATEIIGNGSTATKVKDYCVKDINLCNVHSSDAVLVDLYITNTVVNDARISRGSHLLNTTGGTDWDNTPTSTTSTYYIIKNLEIAKGISLYLDEQYLKGINFNFYQLYIKLNNADSAVDVIVGGKKDEGERGTKQAIKLGASSSSTLSSSNY